MSSEMQKIIEDLEETVYRPLGQVNIGMGINEQEEAQNQATEQERLRYERQMRRLEKQILEQERLEQAIRRNLENADRERVPVYKQIFTAMREWVSNFEFINYKLQTRNEPSYRRKWNGAID